VYEARLLLVELRHAKQRALEALAKHLTVAPHNKTRALDAPNLLGQGAFGALFDPRQQRADPAAVARQALRRVDDTVRAPPFKARRVNVHVFIVDFERILVPHELQYDTARPRGELLKVLSLGDVPFRASGSTTSTVKTQVLHRAVL
jgi:hypothetical protein